MSNIKNVDLNCSTILINERSTYSAHEDTSGARNDGQRIQHGARLRAPDGGMIYDVSPQANQNAWRTSKGKMPERANRLAYDCALTFRCRHNERCQRELDFSDMPGIKWQFEALVSAMAESLGESRLARLRPSTRAAYRKRYWPDGLTQLKWLPGAQPDWDVYSSCFPELHDAMRRYFDSYK